MVKLVEIIRAEKTNISIGEWKEGKIPIPAFPLKGGRGKIPVGPPWQWRLCTFDALGLLCRVLIRVNIEKGAYYAMLGVESGGEFRVICHHDLHVPDKGWHCHFILGNVLDSFPGVLRDKDRVRMYESHPSKAAAQEFEVTMANALTFAAQRYQFAAQGELL